MKAFYLAIVVLSLLALAACEREGPAEKAGRALDQAVDQAGRNVENAGKDIRDAAKDK
jgi:predicted small lipoprotein YifL